MKTNEIIAGLRNCVVTQFTGCKECPAYCRSANCLNRLHTAAADTLEAQQKRIDELEAELKDERHRHDRYVDFELAQAKELEQLRAERRWIPVTERLPEHSDGHVLVTDGEQVKSPVAMLAIKLQAARSDVRRDMDRECRSPTGCLCR